MRRNSSGHLISAVNWKMKTMNNKKSTKMLTDLGASIQNMLIKKINTDDIKPNPITEGLLKLKSLSKLSDDMRVEINRSTLKIDIKKVKKVAKKPEEMSLRELIKSTDRIAGKKIEIKKVKLPASQ
jgi:hypothetical protein